MRGGHQTVVVRLSECKTGKQVSEFAALALGEACGKGIAGADELTMYLGQREDDYDKGLVRKERKKMKGTLEWRLFSPETFVPMKRRLNVLC